MYPYMEKSQTMTGDVKYTWPLGSDSEAHIISGGSVHPMETQGDSFL